MTKHRTTLAAVALALTTTAAFGYNRAPNPNPGDPGLGRLSGAMTFQDWINYHQRDHTLGNRAVTTAGETAYGSTTYGGTTYGSSSGSTMAPSGQPARAPDTTSYPTIVNRPMP